MKQEDWNKYRLPVAGGVLVLLFALTVWQVTRSRPHDTASDEGSELPVKVPDLDKAKIDGLEVHRPGEPPIVLAKQGASWQITAPVQAEADVTAVMSALDKLDELEATGVAAYETANHSKLEVDDAHGVRVIARGNGKVLADLIVGAFVGGNTMVRPHGAKETLRVSGSMKYVFDKAVKDWRNRSIVDVPIKDVVEVSFQSPKGTFRFEREGDEWKPAKGQKAIARFESSKVQSIVVSAAQMRAVDFAEGSVTAEQAGVLGDNVARVTLKTGNEAGAQEIVLRVGKALGEEQFYLQRAGNPIVFVVSKFMAERLTPGQESFQKAADAGAADSEEAAPSPMGMPGMPGGGGQIPPELMQKIQQQLQQQGGH